MNSYTVIAIYRDNEQPFAGSYAGKTPLDATAGALAEHPDLIVAAVVPDNTPILA